MQYLGDYLITHSFIIRPHTITAFDNTIESKNKEMPVTQQ